MTFIDDLRAAARTWLRQPGFALFAIALVAAGVAAATSVFTLVNAVLLRDMPLRDPVRLAWMYNARTERDRAPFSIADLEDYRRASVTIEGFAPFTNWTANLTGAGEPERLEGSRVAGSFFNLLGVAPLLGRTIEPRDEEDNARVVVLTHGLWTRRFGADAAAVGRTIALNGATYTIVGVLPSTFLFPFRASEVAVPLQLRDDPRRTDRGANFLRVVARLKPGVTFAQAKADLDRIARTLQERYPADDARKIGVNLYPLHEEIVSDYTRLLWVVFAAVSILLLIGCGNLANLILLRTAGRMQELAIRRSLGAAPRRIVRQLTIEATMLVVTGSALGIVAARWMVDLWRAIAPANFPAIGSVSVDGRAMLFAGSAALVTIAVAGALPAWSAAREASGIMIGPHRTATGSRRYILLRRGFVAVQLMGSSALLIAIGLTTQAFARLQRVDAGFTPDHALTMQLSLPPQRYSTPAAIAGFVDALAPRLAEIPATQSVGAVSLLPLSGLLSAMDLAFPGRPEPPPDRVPQAHFRMATEGYFAAAGIPILEGREFERRDSFDSPLVAVVSRTLAARHWPGESAVGKQLQINSSSSRPIVIVGIAADVRQQDIDGPPTADLYVPMRQMPPGQAALVAARMYWVARTQDEPGLHAQAVRAAVRSVDPDVAATSLRTLEDVLSGALAARSASVRLIAVFAQAAITLAAIGVYAVAAFSTASRRRELAIRSAFGARARDLLVLVIRGELPSIAIGVGAGVFVAASATPLLNAMLYETNALDPMTYAGAAAAMLSAGTIATFVAARRELRRVDTFFTMS
jgi:putative ABC transport system permease protein